MDKYPPPIAKLFAPKPPLRHLEPIDVEPALRKTREVSGIAQFLALLSKPVNNDAEPAEAVKSRKSDKAKKLELQRSFLKDAVVKWNPESDPHINGDPYKTVFVGRLDYSVTELDLQQIFSNYGEVEKIRVVRDKDSNNSSRGYGFVLYKHTHDAKIAYDRANGLKIKNRAIVVDIERGRVVKNWKPRRLGGGLGGRTVKLAPQSQLPSHPTPRFSSGANSSHVSHNRNPYPSHGYNQSGYNDRGGYQNRFPPPYRGRGGGRARGRFRR
ncbi:unnamed protein product [Kuraishia capsulata CBS 1993]|uniref:RRM domain-containing protein n=1 Tax=Kuraishia capsulata CBS 1993 TaxID=1382522 RepID=W6MIG8_9ASCO|nr:uncharacterized protein KUCA_T00001912001 [Kuraishia capsulata CBS 1993]CDK25941.1 unnamed protein product [Kuraishia capsulata CBS 1993]